MNYTEQVGKYLEYCEFRKELDWNTLKAYSIDLKQFFEYTMEDIPGKEKIEGYITELHKKFKQKTIKRKIASVKCNQRAQTDGFAEQNGRDAERADLTCRY